jgi:tetratricopeptide (TPR) repeat protein
VYSLGVLLYELLTGLTPFDSRDLRSRAYEEMQRVIREIDPPPPSTRVSTHENLPSIAAQRNIEPKKLTSIVRGELDWIVMKCLEKDRTRRYDSPSALANDITHYLSHEPVVAGPPSNLYRLRKFVRRNRALVSVAAAVLAALLVGVVGTTIGLVRAHRAENLAQHRLVQVQRESDKNKVLNEFLLDLLANADPHRSVRTDPRLSDILNTAIQRIDAGALGTQPQTLWEVRSMFGRVLLGLSQPEQARTQLQMSMDLLRRLRGQGDDPDIAINLNLMGMALADLRQLEAAEQTLREAVDMRTRLFGASSAEVGESLGNLASVLLQRDKLDAAEQAYRRCADIMRAAKVRPSDYFIHLSGLAVVLRREGKLDEAEAIFREALQVDNRQGRTDDPDRVLPLSYLAALLMQQGRVAEAEPLQREALRIAQATLPPDHPELAFATTGMASVLQQTGKLEEAEQLYRQAVTMLRSAGPSQSDDLAETLISVGKILKMRGRPDEAEPIFREALDIKRKVFSADHTQTAIATSLLASVLGRPDQQAEADALYRQAFRVFRQSPEPDPMLRMSLLNYSEIPLKQGRFGDAETEVREALELAVRQGAAPIELAAARSRLAYVLAKGNAKLDEAEKLAREALETRQKILPPDSWILASNRSLLGEILLLRGHLDQSAPLLTDSYPIVMRSEIAPPTTKADVRERLARLYEIQGKPQRAEQLRNPTSLPTTRP